MQNMKRCLLAILLAITACAPSTPSATTSVVSVYVTAAAQPWLAKVYTCGAQQATTIRLSDTAVDADVTLRLGEPVNLGMPAFQIDSEDILVVANPARSSDRLTADQVRGLFAGRIDDWGVIDPSKGGQVQVWVFAQGEDVEQAFIKTLAGSPIVSSARLATSPQEMSKAIAEDANAVGVLTRHWKTAEVSDVFTVVSAPVLALTAGEPVGAVKSVLACLQGG